MHNEVDPRYRGAAIPSKAFRLLQSMTGPEDAPANSSGTGVLDIGVSFECFCFALTTRPSIKFLYLLCISDVVPRGQPSNRSPQVRTIPVQVEGNGDSQPYVHPSQQTVPEPRKYTGSSIPSRSFKILQAMTAPSDACGKVL